VGERLIPEVC